MKRRLFLGAAAAAPTSAVMAAVAASAAGREASPGATPIVRRLPHARDDARTSARFPDVMMTSHRGEKLRFYEDVVAGDRINVFNMMYTQCPEICGGVGATLSQMQDLLGERFGREVRFWSITLDPKHDTPKILARQAELHGAREGWTFLTARVRDIERVRVALGFVNPEPLLDRERTSHLGLVRAGNDALDRWTACPGVLPAEVLARKLVWVGVGVGRQAG